MGKQRFYFFVPVFLIIDLSLVSTHDVSSARRFRYGWETRRTLSWWSIRFASLYEYDFGFFRCVKQFSDFSVCWLLFYFNDTLPRKDVKHSYWVGIQGSDILLGPFPHFGYT